MPTPEFPEQLKFPELVDIATAATLLAVNIRKVRRMVALGEACRVPKAG